MSVRQFANSLSIIKRNEHTSRPAALARHVLWQARKMAFPRPIKLRISQSVIADDEPGGVISLVNMLGLYDYNNMNFVLRLLRDGGNFVDVGANIGAYTLIGSENAAVRVVSLEPNPAAFAKLNYNIALNRRENVAVLNVAASAVPGVVRMTNNGADAKNRVVAGPIRGLSTIEVPAETLATVCRRLEMVPDVIKIDVEGHEPEVLTGAGSLLGGVLACIVENGDRTAVVDIMRAAGLEGPFHYRHRLSCLAHAPQALAEDQVFTGPRFRQLFPEIGMPAPA